MESAVTPKKVKNFTCRNTIADAFRTYAKELCAVQGFRLDTGKILFLLDRTSPPQSYSGSEIGRVPAVWSDVLYQYTGLRYLYYIKLWEANLYRLKKRQVRALLYHELRHLRQDAKNDGLDYVRRHDMEDWAELAKYGDWEAECGSLPDVMADKLTEEARRDER